jgi:hypothetical protein
MEELPWESPPYTVSSSVHTFQITFSSSNVYESLFSVVMIYLWVVVQSFYRELKSGGGAETEMGRV